MYYLNDNAKSVGNIPMKPALIANELLFRKRSGLEGNLVYRITKNFRDKKLSRNVTQQYFAKKGSQKKG